MTLHVHTARISSRDPDALDITRAGAVRARVAGKPAPGAFLAPSAGLVFPALRAMKAATTDAARDAVWAGYEAAFHAEMLASYGTRRRRGPDRSAWEALLARPRAVLVCMCVDPARCHRRLVAGYLAKLGAVNGGELLVAQGSV